MRLRSLLQKDMNAIKTCVHDDSSSSQCTSNDSNSLSSLEAGFQNSTEFATNDVAFQGNTQFSPSHVFHKQEGSGCKKPESAISHKACRRKSKKRRTGSSVSGTVVKQLKFEGESTNEGKDSSKSRPEYASTDKFFYALHFSRIEKLLNGARNSEADAISKFYERLIKDCMCHTAFGEIIPAEYKTNRAMGTDVITKGSHSRDHWDEFTLKLRSVINAGASIDELMRASLSGKITSVDALVNYALDSSKGGKLRKIAKPSIRDHVQGLNKYTPTVDKMKGNDEPEWDDSPMWLFHDSEQFHNFGDTWKSTENHASARPNLYLTSLADRAKCNEGNALLAAKDLDDLASLLGAKGGLEYVSNQAESDLSIILETSATPFAINTHLLTSEKRIVYMGDKIDDFAGIEAWLSNAGTVRTSNSAKQVTASNSGEPRQKEQRLVSTNQHSQISHVYRQLTSEERKIIYQYRIEDFLRSFQDIQSQEENPSCFLYAAKMNVGSVAEKSNTKTNRLTSQDENVARLYMRRRDHWLVPRYILNQRTRRVRRLKESVRESIRRGDMSEGLFFIHEEFIRSLLSESINPASVRISARDCKAQSLIRDESLVVASKDDVDLGVAISNDKISEIGSVVSDIESGSSAAAIPSIEKIEKTREEDDLERLKNCEKGAIVKDVYEFDECDDEEVVYNPTRLIFNKNVNSAKADRKEKLNATEKCDDADVASYEDSLSTNAVADVKSSIADEAPHVDTSEADVVKYAATYVDKNAVTDVIANVDDDTANTAYFSDRSSSSSDDEDCKDYENFDLIADAKYTLNSDGALKRAKMACEALIAKSFPEASTVVDQYAMYPQSGCPTNDFPSISLTSDDAQSDSESYSAFDESDTDGMAAQVETIPENADQFVITAIDDATELRSHLQVSLKECEMLRAILHFKVKGQWPENLMPKVVERLREKSHWDYILQEVRWMAADFVSERKFKLINAKKRSQMIREHFSEFQASQLEKICAEEKRRKRICSQMACAIMSFWANLRKLVDYKRNASTEIDVFSWSLSSKGDKVDGVEESVPKGQDAGASLEKKVSLTSTSCEYEQFAKEKSSLFLHPTIAGASPRKHRGYSLNENIRRTPTKTKRAQSQLADSSQNDDEAIATRRLTLATDLLPRKLENEIVRKDNQIFNDFVGAETILVKSEPSDKVDLERDLNTPRRGESLNRELTLWSEKVVAKDGLNRLPNQLDNRIEGLNERDISKRIPARGKTLEISCGATKTQDDCFARPAKGITTRRVTFTPGMESPLASKRPNKSLLLPPPQNVDELRIRDTNNQTLGNTWASLPNAGLSSAVCYQDEITRDQSARGNATDFDDLIHHSKVAYVATGNKVIDEATAKAVAIYPKGNTLSSTEIATKTPHLLTRQLREYQLIGLDWLVSLYENKLNGILSDESGLGKTIQAIALLAHLASDKGNRGPHLIISSNCATKNWEIEFKKWCPALKILTYSATGKECMRKQSMLSNAYLFDVCITSYNLVLRDVSLFHQNRWEYLILDDARDINNFKSKQWQMLFHLNAKRRLLLAGEPLPNSLTGLYSLMRFLFAELFAFGDQLEKLFGFASSGMTEASDEFYKLSVTRLHQIFRPFILRRMKVQVEKQLPKRYEHVIMCALSNRQRYLYDDFMSRPKIKETLEGGNFSNVINVIMQLRKICNHPNLFETLPIVSPFRMGQIEYHTATLLTTIFDHDPTKNLSLGRANAIVDIERQLSWWVAYNLRKMCPSVEYVERIFVDQNTATSLPKETLHLQLCHQPGVTAVENERAFSLETTKEDDCLQEISKQECRSSLVDINNSNTFFSLLNGLLAVGQLNTKSELERCPLEELHPTEISTNAGREIQPRLRYDPVLWKECQIYSLIERNAVKCRMTPLYGIELRRAIAAPLPLKWTDDGATYCAHIRNLRHFHHVTQFPFSALSNALLSIERRAQLLSDIFVRYLIYLPAAHASQPSLRLRFPSPLAKSLAGSLEDCLLTHLGNRDNALHPISVRMCASFPDNRFMRYDSGKLRQLDKLLPQLKAENRRVLIFTQMIRMLDVLEAFLTYRSWAYVRLDATCDIDTCQRSIEKFNADGRYFCFLLTTRLAEIGVDLTGADTVIFYDSDWNPTTNAQTQERCLRLGLTKDIHIYHLISEKTLEEFVFRKCAKERVLEGETMESGICSAKFEASWPIPDYFDGEANCNAITTRRQRMTEMVDYEKSLLTVEEDVDVAAAQVANRRNIANTQEPTWLTNRTYRSTEDYVAIEPVIAIFNKLTPVERWAFFHLMKMDREGIQVACSGETANKRKLTWVRNNATKKKKKRGKKNESKFATKKLGLKKEKPSKREPVAYTTNSAVEEGAQLSADDMEALEYQIMKMKSKGACQDDIDRLLSEFGIERSEESASDGRELLDHRILISKATKREMPVWEPLPASTETEYYCDPTLNTLYDTSRRFTVNEMPVVNAKEDSQILRFNNNLLAPRELFASASETNQCTLSHPYRPPQNSENSPNSADIENWSAARTKSKRPQPSTNALLIFLDPPLPLYRRTKPSTIEFWSKMRLLHHRSLISLGENANFVDNVKFKTKGKKKKELSTDVEIPSDPSCSLDWMIREDYKLLQALLAYQQLPFNFSLVFPGHVPNWTLIAAVVNTVSKKYRTEEDCKFRFENVLLPNENCESEIVQPKMTRKQKSLVNGLEPFERALSKRSKVTLDYHLNDNSDFTRLMMSRFGAIRDIIICNTDTNLRNPLNNMPKPEPTLPSCKVTFKPPSVEQLTMRRNQRIIAQQKNIRLKKKYATKDTSSKSNTISKNEIPDYIFDIYNQLTGNSTSCTDSRATTSKRQIFQTPVKNSGMRFKFISEKIGKCNSITQRKTVKHHPTDYRKIKGDCLPTTIAQAQLQPPVSASKAVTQRNAAQKRVATTKSRVAKVSPLKRTKEPDRRLIKQRQLQILKNNAIANSYLLKSSCDQPLNIAVSPPKQRTNVATGNSSRRNVVTQNVATSSQMQSDVVVSHSTSSRITEQKQHVAHPNSQQNMTVSSQSYLAAHCNVVSSYLRGTLSPRPDNTVSCQRQHVAHSTAIISKPQSQSNVFVSSLGQPRPSVSANISQNDAVSPQPKLAPTAQTTFAPQRNIISTQSQNFPYPNIITSRSISLTTLQRSFVAAVKNQRLSHPNALVSYSSDLTHLQQKAPSSSSQSNLPVSNSPLERDVAVASKNQYSSQLDLAISHSSSQQSAPISSKNQYSARANLTVSRSPLQQSTPVSSKNRCSPQPNIAISRSSILDHLQPKVPVTSISQYSPQPNVSVPYSSNLGHMRQKGPISPISRHSTQPNITVPYSPLQPKVPTSSKSQYSPQRGDAASQSSTSRHLPLKVPVSTINQYSPQLDSVTSHSSSLSNFQLKAAVSTISQYSPQPKVAVSTFSDASNLQTKVPTSSISQYSPQPNIAYSCSTLQQDVSVLPKNQYSSQPNVAVSNAAELRHLQLKVSYPSISQYSTQHSSGLSHAQLIVPSISQYSSQPNIAVAHSSRLSNLQSKVPIPSISGSSSQPNVAISYSPLQANMAVSSKNQYDPQPTMVASHSSSLEYAQLKIPDPSIGKYSSQPNIAVSYSTPQQDVAVSSNNQHAPQPNSATSYSSGLSHTLRKIPVASISGYPSQANTAISYSTLQQNVAISSNDQHAPQPNIAVSHSSGSSHTQLKIPVASISGYPSQPNIAVSYSTLQQNVAVSAKNQYSPQPNIATSRPSGLIHAQLKIPVASISKYSPRASVAASHFSYVSDSQTKATVSAISQQSNIAVSQSSLQRSVATSPSNQYSLQRNVFSSHSSDSTYLKPKVAVSSTNKYSHATLSVSHSSNLGELQRQVPISSIGRYLPLCNIAVRHSSDLKHVQLTAPVSTISQCSHQPIAAVSDSSHLQTSQYSLQPDIVLSRSSSQRNVAFSPKNQYASHCSELSHLQPKVIISSTNQYSAQPNVAVSYSSLQRSIAISSENQYCPQASVAPCRPPNVSHLQPMVAISSTHQYSSQPGVSHSQSKIIISSTGKYSPQPSIVASHSSLLSTNASTSRPRVAVSQSPVSTHTLRVVPVSSTISNSSQPTVLVSHPLYSFSESFSATSKSQYPARTNVIVSHPPRSPQKNVNALKNHFVSQSNIAISHPSHSPRENIAHPSNSQYFAHASATISHSMNSRNPSEDMDISSQNTRIPNAVISPSPISTNPTRAGETIARGRGKSKKLSNSVTKKMVELLEEVERRNKLMLPQNCIVLSRCADNWTDNANACHSSEEPEQLWRRNILEERIAPELKMVKVKTSHERNYPLERNDERISYLTSTNIGKLGIPISYKENDRYELDEKSSLAPQPYLFAVAGTSRCSRPTKKSENTRHADNTLISVTVCPKSSVFEAAIPIRTMKSDAVTSFSDSFPSKAFSNNAKLGAPKPAVLSYCGNVIVKAPPPLSPLSSKCSYYLAKDVPSLRESKQSSADTSANTVYFPSQTSSTRDYSEPSNKMTFFASSTSSNMPHLISLSDVASGRSVASFPMSASAALQTHPAVASPNDTFFLNSPSISSNSLHQQLPSTMMAISSAVSSDGIDSPNAQSSPPTTIWNASLLLSSNQPAMIKKLTADEVHNLLKKHNITPSVIIDASARTNQERSSFTCEQLTSSPSKNSSPVGVIQKTPSTNLSATTSLPESSISSYVVANTEMQRQYLQQVSAAIARKMDKQSEFSGGNDGST